MASRTYSSTNGVCDMYLMYGVNLTRDKTLKDLGYTYQSAKDWAPAFIGYCESRGWTQAEVLSLYEFETAWNDYVIATNFYLGGGLYFPPNNIYHSRAQIIAPDGWFRLRYGCMTALGTYTGKHSNMYSDRSGNNPGCSAGTALEIDHNGWLSSKQPERNAMFSSAWGSDYGIVGGAAYQEGLIIENFRVVGGMSGRVRDTTFKSYGITASNPGEASTIRNCFAHDFNDAGFAVISGTPGMLDTCSSFFNKSEGFLLLGNNGLANTTLIVPSGDDNPALIRIKPLPNSVSGGTYTIIGMKSESRDVMQKPVVVEGPLGQLNLTINGATCDHRSLTCPELIEIKEGGSWQVEVHGLQYGNNVQSLLYHAQSGKRLTGGAAFRGNTFGVNDEGLYLKSRSNMTWTGGTVTPPVDPPVDPPPTGGNLSRAGWTAAASSTDGTNTASKALDGNPASFWMSSGSMTANGPTLTVDMKAVKTFRGLTFSSNTGYANSWPRTFEVLTSDTGVEASFVSRGTFTGALNSVATWATAITGRFVRVKCKTANGNWMNCAEFNVQA